MQKQDLERLIRKHVTDSSSWKPPTGRKSFIRLDLNEGYGSLTKTILSALKKFDAFTVTAYPEYEELNSALAKYSQIKKENISITSGSDHAIQMLLNLFFNEGDHVVAPSPTFFVYFSILKLIGAESEIIAYTTNNDLFVFPFEKTLSAITSKTKGLLLCNPNNPLGSSIPHNQMTALVKKCYEYKIPVIIDEAYMEFSGITAVDLISKYSNLIILRTFSKSFGLAGLRLGYVIAHPSVIKELLKLRLPWAVNHFAVYAGIVALKNAGHFKKELASTLTRKAKFVAFLKEENIFCYKTDTNFIIAKIKNQKKFIKYLNLKGILVNDVSAYPHSNGLFKDCIRINIPSKKDYNKVVKTISDFQSK